MPHARDYIWNSAAGGVGAAEAVVMTMVITRVGTIDDVGVLTIALAIGNQVMTIGKFGARAYHATDVTRTFRFPTYLQCRVITVCLMAITLAMYILLQLKWYGWHLDKVLATIMVSGLYMVEVFEDCLVGELQRNSYLHLGNKMFISRWVTILLAFALTMFITGGLTTSLLVAFVASLIVFLSWLRPLKNHGSWLGDDGGNTQPHVKDFAINKNNVFGLLKQLFPLFLASFLVLYLNNSPKFAIDSVMTDNAQAYFGLLAMPAFVIMLLNQFLYQPTLPTMAAEWTACNYSTFNRRISRQTLALLVISAVSIASAAKFGIPFLSWIYHVDLSDYWSELVILQVAGFFLALSGYLTVVLTIMREGKRLLLGYALTTALSLTIIPPLTRAYGTIGAACGYLSVMLCLSSTFYVMYCRRYKRHKAMT